MHKKQRGKQNKAGNNTNINTFPLSKSKHYLLISKNYCIFVLIFWKNDVLL